MISAGGIVNSIGSCLPGHQQLVSIATEGRSTYLTLLMISCVVYHTSLYLCIYWVGGAYSSKYGFMEFRGKKLPQPRGYSEVFSGIVGVTAHYSLCYPINPGGVQCSAQSQTDLPSNTGKALEPDSSNRTYASN